MPTTPQRTDHKSRVAHKVRGKTLNTANDVANANNFGHVIQRGASGLNTIIKTDIPAPPFIFGLARITDRGNDCPVEISEVPVGNDANGRGYPCRDRDHYLCDFLFYNADTGNFEKYGESLWLDAAGYYEPTDSLASAKSSGPGYGPIPGYMVGDTTPAYLDQLRNRVIPVQSPYCDVSHAVFYNRDNEELIESSTSAQTGDQSPEVSEVKSIEFYIEQSRPGIDNGGFRVIGTCSFPMDYKITGTAFDNRVTFNTAPCPNGTLFRVRKVRGAIDSDDSLVIKAFWQRLRFIGLGRRSPDCLAETAQEPSMRGGDYTFDWTPDESTLHRFKDAPYFNPIKSDQGSQPGLIQVRYLDPKDEWMIGIELHVCIEIENDSETCVKFINGDSETVPANGVMMVVSGATVGQKTTFTTQKPNDTFQRFYLVNGSKDVAPGATGCGHWLEEAGMVLFDDSADSQPAVGRSYGAKSGSWKVFKNRPGFTFMGGVIDAGNAKARFSAIQYQVNNLKGKAPGDLTKGVLGTAKVWMRNAATGDWEESEYTLTDIVRPLGSDLSPDLYISLEWDCGEWSAGCLESG